MGKKTRLPVLPGAFDDRARDTARSPGVFRRPSLDDARQKLGGVTRSDAAPPDGIAPGRVIRVFANDGTAHIAVIVFANDEEVHVLIDGKRLRRVPPDAVHVHHGETPSALGQIAADAHVFNLLSEGDNVRYTDDMGSLLDGTLLEKCRYGALIARRDGVVIAVGFRKLWPAASTIQARA